MYVLTYDEYCRLDEVLAKVIQVHGRGNFPTLEVQPKEFIKLLTARLNQEDFAITDCRLNGSAASYVLNDDVCADEEEEEGYAYNDLDLIFHVKLDSSADFTLIKNSVLETLLNFLPPDVNKERISTVTMKEAYVKKMVKVTNKHDIWSLISLTNEQGRNIELKFVDTMKRQFEFSVDSFQIVLDSLLNFPGVSADLKPSSTLYPSVEAESVYGNLEEARYHLRHKLIATRNPEQIRGGGLLKYCNLLSRDYCAVSTKICQMEKYMCSRFFIDFKDVQTQQHKLENYLKSHSLDSSEKKYKYLQILYDVVEKSTVCLMGHERRQTLRMILDLLNQVYQQPSNYPQITVFYSLPPYMQQSSNSQSYSVSTYTPTSSNNSNSGSDYLMVGSWKPAATNAVESSTTPPVRCY
jgi:hypothetical protein